MYGYTSMIIPGLFYVLGLRVFEKRVFRPIRTLLLIHLQSV